MIPHHLKSHLFHMIKMLNEKNSIKSNNRQAEDP